MHSAALLLGLLLGGTAMAVGQERSEADRVLRAPDGEVRITYRAREDVCGDGRGMIRFRDRESYLRVEDAGATRTGSGRIWYRRPCIDGPARVAIQVASGRVTRVRAYVGGDWPDRGPGATDLGELPPGVAAATLLDLARRTDNRTGDDLVFPAILADGVEIWPALLALARDARAPRSSRKTAIFWLSQEAGESATRDLGAFVENTGQDRDLREHAVFALSQLPREQGVPVLLRVARNNPDPSVRRKAIFWLGQSDDPRALALFEEILTRPR